MKTKILIVDDEEDLREVLKSSLEMRGFEVLTAKNGKVAFDLIQVSPVDVVISDVRMPGGGGVELLQALRAKDPVNPVVILVSGFSDVTQADALKMGAVALYSKPCNLREICQAISNGDFKKAA